MQELDFAHETEGAGATHLLEEGGRGEVELSFMAASFKNRMVKVDTKSYNFV